MGQVMAATVTVERNGDDRSGRALNLRSHVGDLTRAPEAGSDMRHVREGSTMSGHVHHGAWRRPHVHRTRSEVVGLVLWSVVMAASVTAGILFLIDQF
jgi:hypothetical protein